jgi:MFS superfamily sulfate permease-like transporter
MKLQYHKPFVASGLVMILLGLLAPLAHKHAAAPFALVQAHLIGEVQALLFFCLAVLWPVLNLPRFALAISGVSLQIGLWANMIGTMLIGLLGAGKEQYIANMDRIPGLQGLWNDVTNLMINLAAFAVIPIVMAFFGVVRHHHAEGTDKGLNISASILFLLIGTFAILQTIFPEYSNF